MKYLLYFLMCSTTFAGTNYVYYSTQDGRPQQVAADCAYDSGRDTVSMGGATMGGIDWTVIRVASFTAKVPSPFTNVSQVALTPYLPMTADAKASNAAASALSQPGLSALIAILDADRAATNKIASKIFSATTNTIQKATATAGVE